MLLATIISMIIVGSLLWLGLSRSQQTVSNDPIKRNTTVLKPHSNDILTEFGDELSSAREPEHPIVHPIVHPIEHPIVHSRHPLPIRAEHPIPIRAEHPLPIRDEHPLPLLEKELSLYEYLAQTEQHSTKYVDETLNQLTAQISAASDVITHIQQALIEIQLLSDTQGEFQQIE
jgi:hypothetical protein